MKGKGKRAEVKKLSVRYETEQKTVRRCYLCRDRKHLAADCPMKNKGTKCFRCQENGPNCKVEIAHCKLIALIDTNCDLTIMKADQYIKIGVPKLNNKIFKFRGIGSESNNTWGNLRQR
ncbi:unnamed protein product [Heterotrigona itama]|uniref:CCHC-type domain-containing protein n=1 Tax=Heterotrigona itama TaxID=395501 RepID=A0A6V7GSZ4_9HYME|nr:unnamed protein product [Heterotrigona itama]